MNTELAPPPLDRSTYLGSSDIAAILGVSKWKTPYSVWEAKQPGYVEVNDDPERQIRLRRGTRFEPLIIDQFQEETGAWITARGVRYSDEDYPFLRAEVDAEETDEETGDITNIEAKSISAFAAQEFGASGTDEFPSYYAAQMQFALMVTRRKLAKMAALIGTDDMRIYAMPRDEEFIAYMRERAVAFWTFNVAQNVPPPLTDGKDAERMIARFDGLTVRADAEHYDAARKVVGIRTAIKRLEGKKEEFETVLKIAMATGSGVDVQTGDVALVNDNGAPIVTWNECDRKGYTVAPTKYRTMLLKGKNL